MAKKSTKSSGSSNANSGKTSADTNVTRIKAADDKKPKVVAKNSNEKSAKKAEKLEKPNKKNPLQALGSYFKGAWSELKLVRWPTRRAAWGMTAAVLIYTTLFVVLIIVLDLGFNKLLETILG